MPRTKKRSPLGQMLSVATDSSKPVAAVADIAQPTTVWGKIRRWKRHWYIGGMLQLRTDFMNFGFTLRAVEKDKQKDLDEWMDKVKNPANNKRLHTHMRSVWEEWSLMDVVIAFWMVSASAKPTLLNPDEVEYKDEFGQESLTISHNLSNERIDEMDIPEAAKARFKKSKRIKILPDDDVFHFDVIKREKTGGGLGTPRMEGVFQALSTSDSLEAHDAVLANIMRRVYEQHKMGHETRYGVNAGSAANFVKKARQEAVVRETKGKTGHVQTTTNFDHEIVYPGVESDRFAPIRYEGVVNRLEAWAAPLPAILNASSQQPQLMDLFEVQCIEERKTIALHFQMCVEAFNFPCAVEPVWANDCFRDERIFADLLKTALASGPLSQASFLEALNFDPEQERKRKAEEAKLPKDQTTPIFDAAHGDPGAKAPNGRPAGSKDKYARNSEDDPPPPEPTTTG